MTCGYENSISIYKIDGQYLDSNLMGKLIGHNSMVTAFVCIENSPMLISSDDCGIIKIWDIRDLKCIQTLELGFKTIITRLLDVSIKGKICFVGSRINFINFTSPVLETHENLYPIQIEFNINNQELVFASRKDIRFMDLQSAIVTKIYSSIFNNSDDEITIFKCINQFKNIMR